MSMVWPWWVGCALTWWEMPQDKLRMGKVGVSVRKLLSWGNCGGSQGCGVTEKADTDSRAGDERVRGG